MYVRWGPNLADTRPVWLRQGRGGIPHQSFRRRQGGFDATEYLTTSQELCPKIAKDCFLTVVIIIRFISEHNDTLIYVIMFLRNRLT